MKCEFCKKPIERIPFGGHTHSADRNPRCGRNFATPEKNPTAEPIGAGTGPQS
ncbi:hypothetical protein GS531_00625 [Rhodococcus hoagii]|nr:hypothetical protein [Prescottella equi]